jgi:hypothetical protein
MPRTTINDIERLRELAMRPRGVVVSMGGVTRWLSYEDDGTPKRKFWLIKIAESIVGGKFLTDDELLMEPIIGTGLRHGSLIYEGV